MKKRKSAKARRREGEKARRRKKRQSAKAPKRQSAKAPKRLTSHTADKQPLRNSDALSASGLKPLLQIPPTNSSCKFLLQIPPAGSSEKHLAAKTMAPTHAVSAPTTPTKHTQKKKAPTESGEGLGTAKTEGDESVRMRQRYLLRRELSAADSTRSAAPGWPGPTSPYQPAAGSACGSAQRFPWRSRCRGCGCARRPGFPSWSAGWQPPR